VRKALPERSAKSWSREEKRRSEIARAVTEITGEELDGRRRTWKRGMSVAGERE
jgi:hypothetical protein